MIPLTIGWLSLSVFSLGLLGGGGSILTVPLLAYVAGIDAKAAIATSLLVVLAGCASRAMASLMLAEEVHPALGAATAALTVIAAALTVACSRYGQLPPAPTGPVAQGSHRRAPPACGVMHQPALRGDRDLHPIPLAALAHFHCV